jgi:N-acetyl-anhydromuramoyl-L-alanine amidase
MSKSVEWAVDAQGWVNRAKRISSPNFDWRWDRPFALNESSLTHNALRRKIDLLVVHYISLPPDHFGGDAVERLFLNRLQANDPNPQLAELAGLKVSAHFFIRRHGGLVQFVSCDYRAWHAGVSSFQGRERCNDFSIGIEFEGNGKQRFTARQYQTFAKLSRALLKAYGIVNLAGHQDIAPGRKQDPGPFFDWAAAKKLSGLF